MNKQELKKFLNTFLDEFDVDMDALGYDDKEISDWISEYIEKHKDD